MTIILKLRHHQESSDRWLNTYQIQRKQSILNNQFRQNVFKHPHRLLNLLEIFGIV